MRPIESQAWDGAWYTRAFDAAGQPVGSKSCEEGKVFIESQAWCVLGGAGQNNGRAKKALQAVDKYLYTPDLGCALQYPPYSTYHLELGEVTSYPPGYKENAGVFSHNNTWIHIGWTLFGEGEKALEYYLSVCPSAKKDHDVYRSEPYVYAQMTASQFSPTPGEAKNSWLTGTGAWSLVTAQQYILGVRPDYNGLRIDPCIPKKWKGYHGAAQIPRRHLHDRGLKPEGALEGRQDRSSSTARGSPGTWSRFRRTGARTSGSRSSSGRNCVDTSGEGASGKPGPPRAGRARSPGSRRRPTAQPGSLHSTGRIWIESTTC